jgi:hypothetical protein
VGTLIYSLLLIRIEDRAGGSVTGYRPLLASTSPNPAPLSIDYARYGLILAPPVGTIGSAQPP